MKTKINREKLISITLRYSILILFGLGDLFIFYKLFTPLTIYLVSSFLSLLYPIAITNNTILFNTIIIELIPACIAGSAYYLLLILNLSTPNIKIIRRLGAIALSMALLLVLNSSRIIFLSVISNSYYFNQIHMIFWYFITTLFVILIWIFTIKIFKIKSVPFYSDIKSFYDIIK
ncbi:MAG: pacearchaeosortase [archaeon]